MIAAVLFALTLAPQQAQTYDLRVKGKVGDTYRIRTEATLTAVNATGTLELVMTMSQKIRTITDKEVRWDVVYKLERAEDSGVFKGAASQFSDLDRMKVILKQDRYSRPIAVSYDGMEIKNEGDATVTFPTKPARIGTEWTAKIDVASQKIPIIYRLEKVGTYQGRKAAYIMGAFPKGSPATSIKPVRFIVELANGITLKFEGTTKINVGGNVIQAEYKGGRV